MNASDGAKDDGEKQGRIGKGLTSLQRRQTRSKGRKAEPHLSSDILA